MGPVNGQVSYRSFSDGLSETTLVSSLHGALGYVGYRMNNKNLCGRTLTLGKSAEQGLGKDQSCLPSQEFSWTGFSKPLEARLLLGKWKHDKPRCSKAWLSRWASVSTPLVPGFSGPGHIGWSVQAQGTLRKSQFPSCSHSDPSTLSMGNGLSEPS